MRARTNMRCFVVVILLWYCTASKISKIRGLEGLLPAPETHEIPKLVLQNNGNQHWVETPKTAEDGIEYHRIAKRQSGLNLVDSITKTAALETAVVNKHNELRSSEALQENVALMEKMSGSSDLANFAKSVTNTCYFDHSTNAARTNKFGFSYFGENLAVTTSGRSSPESQIQSWFNEKSDYNYNTNGCTLNEMCGHYTQIVWGTSKYIGCAVTFCPIMRFPDGDKWSNAYFLACNYGPGGNYRGQRPYTKSTTCAGCRHTCTQGLCDENAAATTTTAASITTPTPAPTTSTAAPVTTPAATIPGCVAMDFDQYCAFFDTNYNICSGTNNYLDFAIDNCKATCNFCQCRDYVNTCSSYISTYNVCAWGTQNYWYGLKYCKKTCGIC